MPAFIDHYILYKMRHLYIIHIFEIRFIKSRYLPLSIYIFTIVNSYMKQFCKTISYCKPSFITTCKYLISICKVHIHYRIIFKSLVDLTHVYIISTLGLLFIIMLLFNLQYYLLYYNINSWTISMSWYFDIVYQMHQNHIILSYEFWTHCLRHI